jgi:hypothetical protein
MVMKSSSLFQKKIIPGSTYISKALAFYNNLCKEQNLKTRLQYESNIVKNNSLEILDEFEKLEDKLIE